MFFWCVFFFGLLVLFEKTTLSFNFDCCLCFSGLYTFCSLVFHLFSFDFHVSRFFEITLRWSLFFPCFPCFHSKICFVDILLQFLSVCFLFVCFSLLSEVINLTLSFFLWRLFSNGLPNIFHGAPTVVCFSFEKF